MEPIKCLIVDDDKPAHLVLKSHISQCNELEFISSAYNGKEAINSIKEQVYDLIFLDINMPLITGMELLKTLEVRPPIIITTAYCDFAFEAYQYDAVDYLLKPISYQRFLKSIEKAKKYISSIKENESKIFSIKHKGDNLKLDLEKIIYLQSIGNYLKVYLENIRQPIVVYHSLKSFNDLISNKNFVQVHKSYIVNINCIMKVEKENILLNNQIIIPLGRKYSVLLNAISK